MIVKIKIGEIWEMDSFSLDDIMVGCYKIIFLFSLKLVLREEGEGKS